MDLLGIVAGYASFHLLKRFKKPMRKTAVTVTSEMFNVMDKARETAYNAKEGFEDIIAEAHYENMKRKQQNWEPEFGIEDEKGE